MTDFMQKYIHDLVSESMQHNQESVQQALFTNTNEQMTRDELTAVMSLNCIAFSTRLSVQMTLELLEAFGVLEIDEEQLKRNLLHIVK